MSLFTVVGEQLESYQNEKDGHVMQKLFSRLGPFKDPVVAQKIGLSSRARFMIEDLFALRKRKWKPLVRRND